MYYLIDCVLRCFSVHVWTAVLFFRIIVKAVILSCSCTQVIRPICRLHLDIYILGKGLYSALSPAILRCGALEQNIITIHSSTSMHWKVDTAIKLQFIHPRRHIYLQAYSDKISVRPSTHTFSYKHTMIKPHFIHPRTLAYKHTVIKQFISPCTHTLVHLHVCSDKTSVHPSMHTHTLAYRHTAVRLYFTHSCTHTMTKLQISFFLYFLILS